MPSDHGHGLLAQCMAAGSVVVVPMWGVQFVAFDDTRAIGTQLGACSAAVVLSERGAILAHIPPLPAAQSPDPHAGDNNVRSMMGRVQGLYLHCRRHGYFPSASAHVVSAWYRDEIALPSQQAIIQHALGALGLPPANHTYNVAADRGTPGQGSVVAIAAAPGPPTLYVEDRPVG